MKVVSASTRDRLRLALDLYEAGERVIRENIRRGSPQASEARVERQLTEWLAHRPGAEDGDCPGGPRSLSLP